MKDVGIVGFGFMGAAIARGLRKLNPAVQISIVEKDAGRRAWAIQDLGAHDCTADPAALCTQAELVVLAVKPQDLRDAATMLGPAAHGSRVLSIIAGTPIATIRELLGTTAVARAMPNLAAEVGAAVVGLTIEAPADPDFRAAALELCSAIGTVIEVREELLHAITGVSGSGIAYVFEFIHHLAMGAVREGLPYAQAVVAAREVVWSAAQLLRENATHPMEMVSRVCSPAGTTIQGIHQLQSHGFGAAVMDAVSAAAERSRRM